MAIIGWLLWYAFAVLAVFDLLPKSRGHNVCLLVEPLRESLVDKLTRANLINKHVTPHTLDDWVNGSIA